MLSFFISYDVMHIYTAEYYTQMPHFPKTDHPLANIITMATSNKNPKEQRPETCSDKICENSFTSSIEL